MATWSRRRRLSPYGAGIMSVTSILPPNAKPHERALEAATARLGEVPTPITPVWDVDACSVELLPYLAWALSVDDWSEAWPERVKRNVIRAAIGVHRHKGTLGAVHRALEAMDLDLIRIIEWHEMAPAASPYTFEVEVGTLSRGVSEGEHQAIIAAVMKAKNLRSHLAALRLYLQTASPAPYLATALLQGANLTVYPHQLTELQQDSATPYQAAALHHVITIMIYPEA